MKKLSFTVSFFVFVAFTGYGQTQMIPRAPHSANENPTLVEVSVEDPSKKKVIYMPATSASENVKKIESQGSDNGKSNEVPILDLKYSAEEHSKGAPSKKGAPK